MSYPNQKGVTLPELMIAVVILTVGIMGFIASFTGISKSIVITKSLSIASNLVQEKIETLKQLSYYRLLTTKNYATDNNFSPAIKYDTTYYTAESLTAGNMSFTRYTYISKVRENNSTLTELSWSATDTGLKMIKVYVVWRLMGDWKQSKITNLRENPARESLDAAISGTVETGILPLEGALVKILENTSFNADSDVNGAYNFSLEPGTYTARASKTSYFSQDIDFNVSMNESLTNQNFNLVEMTSGAVSGSVWMRDHIVISQVVASSVSGVFDQEFIELFNPTTSPFTIATDATTGAVDIYYQKMATPINLIDLDYSVLTIPASGYYLIANTTTIKTAGASVNADAVYDSGQDINTIENNKEGGIGIAPAGTTDWIDRFGWTSGGNKPAILYETEGWIQPLAPGQQIIRFPGPSNFAYTTYGCCYDSDDNRNNVLLSVITTVPARNSTVIKPIISGTPAIDALVFVNDGLSGSITAESNGAARPEAVFFVPSVATGTWTVIVTSNTSMKEITNVSVAASANTDLSEVILNTTTTMGYVSGTVIDGSGNPIESIVVSGAGGQDTTDALGNYIFGVTPGYRDITANYGNMDPNYVSETTTGVDVVLGEFDANIDFTLASGGGAYGFISTNGVDPLPGIPVLAKQGATPYGNDVSDDLGNFMITDLPEGSYTFEPYIEAQESSSPATKDKTVIGGTDVFVATFTISNAYGMISGTVTTGGERIKTGVLIVITTDTISGASAMPPTLNNAVRISGTIYYSATTESDGTFSISLPGGFTYNVYGWYTTFTGTTPNTIKKDASVTLATGGSGSAALAW